MDAARGLVVVDRNTVPVAVGDVLVTVAASIEIPAKIVFLHPIHNFAVIQYNVEAIGDTPMRSAALSSTPVAVRVHAVGSTALGTCPFGCGRGVFMVVSGLFAIDRLPMGLLACN